MDKIRIRNENRDFSINKIAPIAEVFNLHQHRPPLPLLRRPFPTSIGSNLEEAVHEEEEFYYQPHPHVYDFDSFFPSNSSSNPSLFDNYAMSFDLGYDLGSETENLGCEYDDPSCFFVGGEDDNDDQMNYVTDLFESRQPHVTDDFIWELDSRQQEEPDMEFGFGLVLGPNMDSESDSEQFEVNAGFVNDEDDDFNALGVSNHRYHTGEDESEEFEWERVFERMEHEGSAMNLLIDRFEAMAVSSDVASTIIENSSLGDDGEWAERNIEWEVLLAMNNSTINLPEDHILTMEHDALFGQSVEDDNALKGSPPAAKSVVENLPSLVLKKEDVEQKDSIVVCAVCKDEFGVGEKVSRLPCSHLYHGECILPWLGVRNTCPVCRHELPTDDAEYEKRSCRQLI